MTYEQAEQLLTKVQTLNDTMYALVLIQRASNAIMLVVLVFIVLLFCVQTANTLRR